MALLLYAVLAVLVGNEVVAPPARAPARFALRAAPPQWRRRASWFRGPGPPPPLVRFAPSLLGPALFLFGGRGCAGPRGVPPLRGRGHWERSSTPFMKAYAAAGPSYSDKRLTTVFPFGEDCYREGSGKLKDCGKEQPGLGQLTKILQESWKSPVRSSVRKDQEPWNAGAGSGYSRDRQARWDGREMRTATTKVRREVYEVFRKLCQDQGRTPYGVLKELLLTWIEREAGRLFESGDPAVCVAVEALEEAPSWTGWHSSGGGS